MDSVNSDWDEFKRTLSGIQKANSIREQLNVLSAQLNEIEQDTKVLPELKETIDGEENQMENEQLLQAEQPDPMAMMGGMPPAAPQQAPEGGAEPMMKADFADPATEPIADAVNANDGDDKVMALFDQLIASISEASHQALDAGDIGKLMKLTNIQGNIVALQQDIVPLSASVPVNELGGGEPIAKAMRVRGRVKDYDKATSRAYVPKGGKYLPSPYADTGKYNLKVVETPTSENSNYEQLIKTLASLVPPGPGDRNIFETLGSYLNRNNPSVMEEGVNEALEAIWPDEWDPSEGEPLDQLMSRYNIDLSSDPNTRKMFIKSLFEPLSANILGKDNSTSQITERGKGSTNTAKGFRAVERGQWKKDLKGRKNPAKYKFDGGNPTYTPPTIVGDEGEEWLNSAINNGWLLDRDSYENRVLDAILNEYPQLNEGNEGYEGWRDFTTNPNAERTLASALYTKNKNLKDAMKNPDNPDHPSVDALKAFASGQDDNAKIFGLSPSQLGVLPLPRGSTGLSGYLQSVYPNFKDWLSEHNNDLAGRMPEPNSILDQEYARQQTAQAQPVDKDQQIAMLTTNLEDIKKKLESRTLSDTRATANKTYDYLQRHNDPEMYSQYTNLLNLSKKEGDPNAADAKATLDLFHEKFPDIVYMPNPSNPSEGFMYNPAAGEIDETLDSAIRGENQDKIWKRLASKKWFDKVISNLESAKSKIEENIKSLNENTFNERVQRHHDESAAFDSELYDTLKGEYGNQMFDEGGNLRIDAPIPWDRNAHGVEQPLYEGVINQSNLFHEGDRARAQFEESKKLANIGENYRTLKEIAERLENTYPDEDRASWAGGISTKDEQLNSFDRAYRILKKLLPNKFDRAVLDYFHQSGVEPAAAIPQLSRARAIYRPEMESGDPKSLDLQVSPTEYEFLEQLAYNAQYPWSRNANPIFYLTSTRMKDSGPGNLIGNQWKSGKIPKLEIPESDKVYNSLIQGDYIEPEGIFPDGGAGAYAKNLYKKGYIDPFKHTADFWKLWAENIGRDDLPTKEWEEMRKESQKDNDLEALIRQAYSPKTDFLTDVVNTPYARVANAFTALKHLVEEAYNDRKSGKGAVIVDPFSDKMFEPTQRLLYGLTGDKMPYLRTESDHKGEEDERLKRIFEGEKGGMFNGKAYSMPKGAVQEWKAATDAFNKIKARIARFNLDAPLSDEEINGLFSSANQLRNGAKIKEFLDKGLNIADPKVKHFEEKDYDRLLPGWKDLSGDTKNTWMWQPFEVFRKLYGSKNRADWSKADTLLRDYIGSQSFKEGSAGESPVEDAPAEETPTTSNPESKSNAMDSFKSEGEEHTAVYGKPAPPSKKLRSKEEDESEKSEEKPKIKFDMVGTNSTDGGKKR